ncbi:MULTISPECIES: YpiB family protein [Macrococcus]|uniref:YpiB family protein n=1 Tax=Macrococcus psychrotolerans TaxID=3039389 RepID=A0AAT9P2L4_9STAP|nr:MULTISPECIES: YpiB family protein [Macrococcus]MDJ1111831.1 YpiB family protein [Macrococcus sp. S115]QYA31884.1 YpiB family protein [Macrococcus sp. 19Msa1099]QYA36690.1 YpiB family protein [Macrococcus caseolyticus]QYA75398.1 YpiB family protein [Macrococcus caseolyticus]
MTHTNIVDDRRNYIRYLLLNHNIDNKNTVWILNLLKDRDDILSYIHIMRADAFINRLIIYPDFKCHLVLAHGIITDAFVIFHYLSSLNHDIYLDVILHDNKYVEIEIKELLSYVVISLNNFEYKEIKNKLHYIQHNEIIKKEVKRYIEPLIEETLVNKDKDKFNQLTHLLQMIGE